MGWDASLDDRALGRLVKWFAFLTLLAIFVVLLFVYLRLSGGELPFSFRDIQGVPAWAPFLAFVVGFAVFAAAPAVLGRVSGRPATFYDLIARNRRNSILLAVATILGTGLTAYALFTVVSLHASVGLAAAIIATIASSVLAIGTWLAGDRIVLGASSARPVDPTHETELVDVVNEIAVAANIPPPAVYVIEADAPNAFSTGRDPAHAAIVVTRGLLAALDREELQAVVAHELSHIRNMDTRYGLFVAVLVGTTVLIADGFFRTITWPARAAGHLFENGGQTSGGGSAGSWSFPDLDFDVGNSGGGKGGAGIILVILAVILFVIMVFLVAWVVRVVAPLISRLVQLAASQEREYLADASAVELGRNPRALERALATVASTATVLPEANRSTAPLYFVDPIRRFEQRAAGIWSTHPPTLERINRLRALQGEALLEREAAATFLEDRDVDADIGQAPEATRRGADDR